MRHCSVHGLRACMRWLHSSLLCDTRCVCACVCSRRRITTGDGVAWSVFDRSLVASNDAVHEQVCHDSHTDQLPLAAAQWACACVSSRLRSCVGHCMQAAVVMSFAWLFSAGDGAHRARYITDAQQIGRPQALAHPQGLLRACWSAACMMGDIATKSVCSVGHSATSDVQSFVCMGCACA